MDLNIDFLTSKNYARPARKPVAKGERSAEGGMWCVTVMPVAGLFMELFASNWITGAVLWALVIFLIWFGCFADLRQISGELDEASAARLRPLRMIPPAYICVRDKMRTGEYYRGIVLGILMAAAIVGNGFTQGLMVNEKSIPEKLKKSSVVSLSNFKGSSDNIIGEQLDSWFDGGYDTECTKSGTLFSTVYSGKHGGKSASVTIEIVHDGYAYRSIKATDVTIDGKKQEDDELRDTLKEIFIGDDENGTSVTTDGEDSTESSGKSETSEKDG